MDDHQALAPEQLDDARHRLAHDGRLTEVSTPEEQHREALRGQALRHWFTLSASAFITATGTVGRPPNILIISATLIDAWSVGDSSQ